MRLHLNTPPRENLLFALLLAVYWASSAVYYGFLIMYLSQNGYSEFMCGTVTTLMSLGSVISQPLSGYIADTYISSKRFIILSFLVALPLIIFVPLTISIAPLAILSIVILSLFTANTHALIDSWIVQLMPRYPMLDYGTVRSWGSVGYAVSALIFGQLIPLFGFNIMFIAHAALLLIMVGLVLMLPAVPCMNSRKELDKLACDDCGRPQQKLSMGKAVLQLMKIKPYVIFVVSVVFYQIAMRVSAVFLPMIITQAGGNSSHLGLAAFISALGEAPVMIIASRAMRRNPRNCEKLLVFAFSVALVRIMMYYFFLDSLTMIIASQIIQSLFSGIYVAAFITYISFIAPENIKSTATTLCIALSIGGGGIFGSMLGGIIIERYGMQNYILFSTAMMFVALLCFLPLLFGAKKIHAERQLEDFA